MYKLFIVDDDYHIRDGLENHIDWHRFHIEVVGVAANGMAALPLIEETKPDIVITDVMMPQLNGIELAKHIRKTGRAIKIIFISGYDDINYIRETLRLSAVDYILKPIKPQDIYTVLERVIKLLDNEGQKQEEVHRMKKLVQQSMPLLRQKFFLSLIQGYQYEADVLLEKLEFLELNLSAEGQFCVLMICLENCKEVFREMDENWRQYINVSLLHICQEILDTYNCGYIFESEQGEYVAVLGLENDDFEDMMLSMVENIKENIAKRLLLNVIVGLGEIVGALSELNISYISARRAVGNGKTEHTQISVDSLHAEVPFQTELYMIIWREASQLLELADSSAVEDWFERIFQRFCMKERGDIHRFINICIQLLLCAESFAAEFGIALLNNQNSGKTAMDKLLHYKDIERMRAYLVGFYKELCIAIAEKRRDNTENLVQRVKSIIDERYAENLTVRTIAEDINFTYTYVCMLFKQKTGMTVNTYLTKVRMEKAKELILTGKYKLYNICNMVGYQDPGYFSKQFKRYTGLNPSEFE